MTRAHFRDIINNIEVDGIYYDYNMHMLLYSYAWLYT